MENMEKVHEETLYTCDICGKEMKGDECFLIHLGFGDVAIVCLDCIEEAPE